MEYTQWDKKKVWMSGKTKVLILVVMEYTQWAVVAMKIGLWASLNPCCNGIYSMR